MAESPDIDKQRRMQRTKSRKAALVAAISLMSVIVAIYVAHSAGLIG